MITTWFTTVRGRFNNLNYTIQMPEAQIRLGKFWRCLADRQNEEAWLKKMNTREGNAQLEVIIRPKTCLDPGDSSSKIPTPRA